MNGSVDIPVWDYYVDSYSPAVRNRGGHMRFFRANVIRIARAQKSKTLLKIQNSELTKKNIANVLAI